MNILFNDLERNILLPQILIILFYLSLQLLSMQDLCVLWGLSISDDYLHLTHFLVEAELVLLDALVD
jgi:hypothetical protein